MTDEITLIGGSHHLTKTLQRDHLISRLAPESYSDIIFKKIQGESAFREGSIEYYELKEFECFGSRRWFYVFKGIRRDDALRLIDFEFLRRSEPKNHPSSRPIPDSGVMNEIATRPKLTKRELWLMQKSWDMAYQTSQRTDGFKTMDEWLANRTGMDSLVKDGLELCAPRDET